MKTILTSRTDIAKLKLGTYRDERGLVLVKRGSAATFFAIDSTASRGLRRLGRWPQLSVEAAFAKLGVNDPTITLRQLIGEWAADSEGPTRTRLAGELAKSDCQFLDVPAVEVTKLAVANWRRSVAVAHTLIVSEKLLKALRSVFKWALATGRYDGADPTHGLPKVKNVSQARERVITFEEFRKINSAIAERSRPLLHFLLLTGCRVNEAISLNEDEEVDFERRVWSVPAARNKTRVAKQIPLSDQAVQLLVQRPHFDSWGVTYKQFWLDFEAARVATGISNIIIHDLRRTWATIAGSHATLTEIGAILGHSSTAVTQIYARQQLAASQRLIETVATQITEGTTC